MTYTTVFDLGEVGYRAWWFPTFGLVFVVIGVLLAWFRRRHPPAGGSTGLQMVVPLLLVGFSLLWTFGTFMQTYGEYWRLSRALRSGNVQVVEGRVSGFVPMPFEGHSSERFCVNGACFVYSDFVVTPGFNNTASHGGPIRLNLPVRVTYAHGVIVRLETGVP